MARQGYYTNPAEKKIEVFHRFDGGMNTVTADENMADNESFKTINMDLVERGPLRRRHGMKPVNNIVPSKMSWDLIGAKKWSEL